MHLVFECFKDAGAHVSLAAHGDRVLSTQPGSYLARKEEDACDQRLRL